MRCPNGDPMAVPVLRRTFEAVKNRLFEKNWACWSHSQFLLVKSPFSDILRMILPLFRFPFSGARGSKSIWAVFKIPLSFRYTGWLIGNPLLEHCNPQHIIRQYNPLQSWPSAVFHGIIIPITKVIHHYKPIKATVSWATTAGFWNTPQFITVGKVPSAARAKPSCAKRADFRSLAQRRGGVVGTRGNS